MLEKNMHRFEPGKFVFTDDAYDAIPLEVMRSSLLRHLSGDFTEMQDSDQWANNWAIKNGGRVFSAYNHENIRFYIITEHDRSITTLRLANEY